MLSFSKLCTKTMNFRLLFSIKSNNFNINLNRSHLSAHNCLMQFKLCNTLANLEEIIPLEEISNLTVTYKNFNKENMPLLLDAITRHKTCGLGLPKYIKLVDVRDILECETSTQRSRYLTYLFKKEQIKLKSKQKKLKNKTERESKSVEDLESNDVRYGLGKNTLFLRAFRRNIMRYYDKRLANAVLFGQKVVIDLGYDKFMTKKEKKACIYQVRLLYSLNKLSRNPYDLYFCNASSENRCVEYLRHEMPNIDESFATLTELSYLDLFPKENLVYLSPHASETLTTYDHNAVYIIGGFVDTVKREDVSSFKAQEEGIKSYRLPLEEFVAWGVGSKSLTINQVFSILQTKRDTDDWKEAFKHLPTRKLKRINVNSEEKELYSDKLCALSSN